jgi:uncharacterized Zn-finger protein
LKSHTPSLLCEADPGRCVARFTSHKELDRHYLANHKVWADGHDYPVSTTSCEACGRTFSRPDNKKRHVKESLKCREKVEKIEKIRIEESRATITG